MAVFAKEEAGAEISERLFPKMGGGIFMLPIGIARQRISSLNMLELAF